MKRGIKFITVLLLLLGLTQLLNTPQASAAIQEGYFTGNYDSGNGGDFVLPQDYSSSIVGGPASMPDSVNSVSSLKSFIENKYRYGNAWEKAGAGYIIQTMRKEQLNSSGVHSYPTVSGPNNDLDDWKKRIDDFIAAGGFVQWDNSYSYCKNTLDLKNHSSGDGDSEDIAPYDDCDTELHTVKFIINKGSGNQVVYAIKRRCANPVGVLSGLDKMDWTLTGTSSVNNYPTSTYNSGNPKAIGASDTVTFRHSVRNNGPYDSASYTWYVEGKYNGSVWTRFQCSPGINDGASPCSLPGGSPSGVGSGTKNPSAVPITYKFPSGAVANDVYCERITYNHAGGITDSSNSSSTASCVKLSSSGGGDCTDGTVPPAGCSATCTVNSITGSGPDGIVLDGERPTVTVTITNTGTRDLPDQVGGHNLAFLNAGTPYPAYQSIPSTDPDSYAQFSFQMAQPAAQPSVNISGTVVYDGAYFLATEFCPGSATVYRHFNIEPHTSVNMDTENPTTINYTTGGTKTEGPDVNVTDTSWLIYQNTGAKVDGDHVTSPRNYGAPGDESFNWSPSSIKAGDQYCSHVIIDPANGYADSGGNIYPNGRNAAERVSPTCPTVHNEPYFHVLNSDVSAGGGFGANCTVIDAGINAYTRTTGTQAAGSGVQIGALSIKGNYGLNTANLRTSAPVASLGLAFSNTSNTSGGSSHSPAMGGNLGTMGSNSCVPDYYATKSADLAADTANSVDVSTLNGKKYYQPNGGTLTITSSAGIANGKGIVLYVEGNVAIPGNIGFIGAANYGSPDTIPSLYIIAKGNIYVGQNVTSLDGEYIAQPNGGSGGNIYSCASGSTPLKGLGECRQQLVVNGSFVAQRVYLLRTFGSIRDSLSGEYLGKARATNVCSDSGTTSLGDCASEIFNFSPESYLARPPFPPSSGPTTGKYKYITSLAPVL